MSTHRAQGSMPDLTSRKWRRLLVLSLYGGQFVMAALWWNAKELGLRAPEVLASFVPILDVLFPVAMVITLASLLMLHVATRQAGLLPDRAADERQRMVRDRAHRIAYRMVGVILALIQLGVLIVAEVKDRAHSPLLVNGMDLIMVLAVLVVNMVHLPAVVVAWTEPD